ncbi:MAG: DUF4199 domain-containing protein [Flavitalea sp.]
METTARKNNYGLPFGLIAGLVVCTITLLQYLGGLDMYLSPVGYVIYLVIIIMAVLACIRQKKENGGYLEFGEALKTSFTVFALALLFQTLFTFVLFNYIDVPFKQAVSQEVMNKTEVMMKKFGASDSQIDEALENERGKDQFAFSRVMLGYAISCIISFLLCLIISVSIRKSKPVFENI